HGFQPVSFAADLGPGYPGEAFFGPTGLAAKVLDGETVTRDAPAPPGTPAEEPDDTPQIIRKTPVDTIPDPLAEEEAAAPEPVADHVEPPVAEAAALPEAAPEPPKAA